MGGKRMTYSFQERLQFSKGARQASDIETIKSLLDGCSEVREAKKDLDLLGVDYIATLRKGAEVYVDAKTRQAGCSRFWRGEPEIAIETWSVMPGGKFQTTIGKTGWTLDEAKITDLVLYTFDYSDCKTAFLLPFQNLRIAARRMVRHWMQRFKVDVQTTQEHGRQWESQVILVPISEVILALETTYSGAVPEPKNLEQSELF
jgi:hypothetical protein